MDDLEYMICAQFLKYDIEEDMITNEISIKDAEKALSELKQLNLSIFQIHMILGLSECEGDGIIKYRPFSKVCADYIRQSYSFEI